MDAALEWARSLYVPISDCYGASGPTKQVPQGCERVGLTCHEERALGDTERHRRGWGVSQHKG